MTKFSRFTVFLATAKSWMLKVPTSVREGKLSNPRAQRARHAGRKITKIYGNPRARAVRALCIDFAAAKNTVCVYTHTKFSMYPAFNGSKLRLGTLEYVVLRILRIA